MTLSNNTFKRLRKIVGNIHCTQSREDLVCYAYDAATTTTHLPDAVVFPENADEISDILKLAGKERFFVIPRGSGSGMTGGSVPAAGGVILVLNRLNRIHHIDTDNLIAVVDPGVITAVFHQAVEKKGLFYPPDPSSSEFSTLGGNLAECAGGPRAVKYGVTRDYVLGLEAVIATGDLIHTGVQTAKGVVGYDLTRLLVGSEGTLGIITRMTLRLLPLPRAVKTALAVFNDMETASKTVSEIIRQGILPRTLEFMDNASIRCVEKYTTTGLPLNAGALLMIETDGQEREAEEALIALSDICMSQGATRVERAQSPEHAKALWKSRKSISPALFLYGPHKINEDIVVPRSRIPQLVQKIDSLRQETGLTMVSFGHAGDGNIHFNIMLDKQNSAALEKANKTVEALFDYTLELGGTLSGEHGVGITKRPYVTKEIGEVELLLMKKIKQTFDTNGILNPGKIFPS